MVMQEISIFLAIAFCFLSIFSVLDATGKPPSGLLLGNLQWLGQYGECMGVSSADTALNSSAFFHLDHAQKTIKGHYCTIDIGNVSPNHTASVSIEGRMEMSGE